VELQDLTEQGKKTEMIRNAKYTITHKKIIYGNCPKKTLKGDFTASQGGVSGIETT
jgi:hypothetical protein